MPVEDEKDRIFAEGLRRLRKKHGYNQEPLAAQVGHERKYISNIEKLVYSPTLRDARRLADLLGGSLDAFYEPDPPKHAPALDAKGIREQAANFKLGMARDRVTKLLRSWPDEDVALLEQMLLVWQRARRTKRKK